MKVFLLLTMIVTVGTVLASDPADTGGARTSSVSSGTDAFTFTEVDTHLVNYIGQWARGLDDVLHTDWMLMTPNTASDSLLFIDYYGSVSDKFPLNNSGAWGCYVYGTVSYGSVNVNDYGVDYIYNSVNQGTSWAAYDNPAESDGRGMDVDGGGTVWETGNYDGVYSFSHLSPTGTYYDLSAVIPSLLSGLEAYDEEGDNYLFLNIYSPDAGEACAYIFDMNDDLNYLGTAEYPFASGCKNLYGITYSPIRDTFFCLYRSNGLNLYLAELQFNATALERSTWGSIKSVF
ncbi:MAG: hypothetical protein GF388_05260 [Candidatus Aegiribacteria sp.]|nr:hypothetical protein [Candidatus Aegiribacteria sp.]MBD3294618.1 hypothetical protein [Candidatus Fermentibacteria bacterium]